LTFAGAKNPLFYIRPNYTEIQEIKGDRLSIGGQLKGNQSFTRHEIILEEQTLIYIGSDGFEDQNNAKRKKLGKSRLKRNLLKIANLPLSVQRNHLEFFLKEHMKGTTQRDDILLIGVLL
ncbi:MAG: SpoIIE family protein phosphatase, partial [Bacteroidota bacterium]